MSVSARGFPAVRTRDKTPPAADRNLLQSVRDRTRSSPDPRLPGGAVVHRLRKQESTQQSELQTLSSSLAGSSKQEAGNYLFSIKGTAPDASAASRSSGRGLSRRSRRCRLATLPNARIIEFFISGCSTSSCAIRRFTRWRWRLRSPHAGQQQPIIGSATSLV